MPVAILDERLRFPNPRLANPEGLVAIGGDLSVQRLLLAYRSGIFPWTVDPITWWSPQPRAILEFHHLHIPRSLARVLRHNPFTITVDQAFERVMKACAAPAQGRRSTWITKEFLEAYSALHGQGHAHSLECWQGDRLVGGIYGVAIGAFFAGESMFHRVSNASKVALVNLVDVLRQSGFVLFDIQMLTPVTTQLGGETISRHEYLRRLAQAVESPCVFGGQVKAITPRET